MLIINENDPYYAFSDRAADECEINCSDFETLKLIDNSTTKVYLNEKIKRGSGVVLPNVTEVDFSVSYLKSACLGFAKVFPNANLKGFNFQSNSKKIHEDDDCHKSNKSSSNSSIDSLDASRFKHLEWINETLCYKSFESSSNSSVDSIFGSRYKDLERSFEEGWDFE